MCPYFEKKKKITPRFNVSYTYNGVRCVQVSDCALMRKLDTMIFVERWPLQALYC